MITDPKTREILKRQGIDPDKYSATTSVPFNQPPLVGAQEFGQQPLPQQNPTVGEKSSIPGAVTRTVVGNAVPTVLGGYGAAAGWGLGALTGPAAPIASPLLALGLGGLTAYLSKGLQDDIGDDLLPKSFMDEYRRYEQQDRATQPFATTAAHLGTSLLGFRFDPKALGGAARSARDIAMKSTVAPSIKLDKADLGNLANVAIGGTIPTAINMYQNRNDPESHFWENVAIFAGGGTINNPRAYLQKAGLPPNIYRQFTEGNMASGVKQAQKTLAPDPVVDPEPAGALKLVPKEGDGPIALTPEDGAMLEYLKVSREEFSALPPDQQKALREAWAAQTAAVKLPPKDEAKAAADKAQAEADAAKLLEGIAASKNSLPPQPVVDNSRPTPKTPANLTDEQKEFGRLMQEAASELAKFSDPKLRNQFVDNIRAQAKKNVYDATPEGKAALEAEAVAKAEADAAAKVEAELKAKAKADEEARILKETEERAKLPDADKTDAELRALANQHNADIKTHLLAGDSARAAESVKAREYYLNLIQQRATGTSPVDNPLNPPVQEKSTIPPELRLSVQDKALADAIGISHKQMLDFSPTERAQLHADYASGKIQAVKRSETSPFSDGKTPLAQAVNDAMKAKGYSSRLSEFVLAKVRALGRHRNVDIEVGSVKNPEGEEIAGMSYLRNGVQSVLARLSRVKANIDTGFHEIFHPFFRDLELYGTKADKKLTADGKAIIAKSKAYENWKSTTDSRDLSVDEFLTEHSSVDVIRRLLELDGKGPFGHWFQDFAAHVRHRFGKASDTDIIRIFSNKLITEPSFAESFGHLDYGPKAPVVQRTEPIEPTPEIPAEIQPAPGPSFVSGRNPRLVPPAATLEPSTSANPPKLKPRVEPLPPADSSGVVASESSPLGDNPNDLPPIDSSLDNKKLGPEDSQMEGRHADFQDRLKKYTDESIKEVIPSGYKKNQLLYTPRGTPIIFQGDALPQKSTGRRLIYGQNVETGDTGTHYLDMMSPEQRTNIKPRDTSESTSSPLRGAEGKLPFYKEAPDVLSGMSNRKHNSADMLGYLSNRIAPGELLSLKDEGLEQFLKLPRTPAELKLWVQGHQPHLETIELKVDASGAQTKRSIEFNEFKHEWYDNLTQSKKDDIRAIEQGQVQGKTIYNYLTSKGWTKDQLKKFTKYQRLMTDAAQDVDAISLLTATARYPSANPKLLKDMEGAVDILVRMPPRMRQGFLKQRKIDPKFVSDHYRPPFGEDLVAHLRGYIETVGDRRIFHTTEIQSDWEKQMQLDMKRRISTGRLLFDSRERLMTRHTELLNHYQRLAAKAAIKYAQKMGATEIAISDGETVGLSQGHNKAVNAARAVNGKELDIYAEQGTPMHRFVNGMITEMPDHVTGLGGELIGGGRFHYDIDPDSAESRIVIDKEPFIAGDDVNYNRILPKIFKELTGDSGSEINFGQHRNRNTQNLEDTGKPFLEPKDPGKQDVTAKTYKLNPDRIPNEYSMFRNKYSESSPLQGAKGKLPFYREVDDIVDVMAGLDTNVKFNKQQFYDMVKTRITSGEFQALVEAGFNRFMHTPRTTQEIRAWIKDNGPTVTTKELAVESGKKHPDVIRYSTLLHTWFDNLTSVKQIQATQAGNAPEAVKYLKSNGWTDAEIEAYNTFAEAKKLAGNVPTTRLQSLSSRYPDVNPKPLAQMNQAVDFLIHKTPPKNQTRDTYGNLTDGIEYRSHHFNNGLGDNLIGHFRGYLETLGDRKIFHVFEVQSDWEKNIKQRNAVRRQFPGGEIGDQPLPAVVEHYQRIAMKAAIKHAQKIGATEIAISDGPTTALTQGHGRAVIIARKVNGHTTHTVDGAAYAAFNDIITKHPPAGFPGTEGMGLGGELIGGGKFHYEYQPDLSRKIVIDKEPYIGGDKQHYDNALPNILKQLTKTTGESVSFGRHQNTKIDSNQGDTTPEGLNNLLDSHVAFKNPDGTPKTDISALSYKLDPTKIPENFSLFNRNYSEKSPLGNDLPLGNNESFGSPISRTTSSGPVGKPAAIIPKLAPEIEKVRHLNTPEAVHIADSTTDFYETMTRLRGELVNPFTSNIRKAAGINLTGALMRPKDYLFQNTEELRNVSKYMDSFRDKNLPRPNLNAQELNILKLIQDSLENVNNAIKARSTLRQNSKFNKNLLPDIPSGEVLRIVKNSPESPEAIALTDEFLKYNAKFAPTGTAPKVWADQMLEKFQKSWANSNINQAKHFSPIDDPTAGYRIPPGWREQNSAVRMERYLDRVARRLAYEDTMTDPDLQKAITKYGANASVRVILDNIAGRRGNAEEIRDSVTGLLKAIKIGPESGLRENVTGLTLGFQHHQNPVQVVKGVMDTIQNWKSNWAESFLSGRNRDVLSTVEIGDGTESFSPHTGFEVLKRARNIVSEATGKNFLEQAIRTANFGQGKYLAQDFLNQPTMSKAGIKFFEDFGRGTNWKSGKLTPAELREVAGRFVDSVQGTYDYRGQPKITMEGSLSPVLALSRWSVEKSNNFMKYVINPARQRNFQPLMMSLLGAFLGGSAAKAVNQFITGYKDKSATWNELDNLEPGTDKYMAVAYKLMGLASYAGTAGIALDLVKSLADEVYGKTKPFWYNNMLIETVAETKQTIGEYLETVAEDGFSTDSLTELVSRLITQNMQAARIIASHMGDDDKIERNNKLRDLRTYKLTHGLPTRDMTMDFSTPFESKLSRRFKKTTDLREAARLSRPLLSQAQRNAQGSPSQLEKELDKLKANSYQTMPSFETDTLEFAKYYQWLKDTQGKEEARDRMQDYFKHQVINRVKSRMIP